MWLWHAINKHMNKHTITILQHHLHVSMARYQQTYEQTHNHNIITSSTCVYVCVGEYLCWTINSN